MSPQPVKEEPEDDAVMSQAGDNDLIDSDFDIDMDEVDAIESGKQPAKSQIHQETKTEPPTAESARDELEDLGLGLPTGIKASDLLDSESDEEYPSSAPAPPPAPAPLQSSFANAEASDPFILRLFYERLFPFKTLFQWLNHSLIPSADMKHREIAMTLNGPGGAEFYKRYLSYNSVEHLKKDIILQIPTRFEIGPIYSTNPRDRKSLPNPAAFKPISKELCFDIDLTDYDDIRTCCDKANICQKCWAFMTMSVKVLDAALRDDFGFKHIMWVYSGRRGIHCWVCDKSARNLNDQQRRAIAGYFDVVRGGAQTSKKVNLRRPLHPHLTRSLELLKPHFQHDVLEAQDPLADPEREKYMLGMIPDKTLQESLAQKWASLGGDSLSKWTSIDTVAKRGAGKNFDTRALRDAKQDIVLEYTYPRLDIEVSKKLNHLLKSPFVVHPGTGRVCVPVDTSRLDEFKPLEVPTVQELLQQIDDWKEESGEGNSKAISDWEKTELKPYINYFRAFVAGLLRDETRSVKRERDMDEDSLDF
ncbi:DNA primase small subunit [Ceratocystis fimbriata CBS 114723]|uniref:DNA primase n=1 Tax=Ceratocystis fimbriata CBS 114723 TaxID=1035309 RepID=A0A2C5W7Y2_9PEZI|nr:DNA primase small subunit [Ceratocystis fimbriata CBS 114723]